MIIIDRSAPTWAQRLVQSITQAIENVWVRPLPVFTTTTLPTATDARWLWRPVVVSNGAGNKWVAISNGTEWRYLEGTAV